MTANRTLKALLAKIVEKGTLSYTSLDSLLEMPEALDRHLPLILGGLGKVPLADDRTDPPLRANVVDPDNPRAIQRYLSSDEEVRLARRIEFTRRRLEWTAALAHCSETRKERYLAGIEPSESASGAGATANRVAPFTERDIQKRWNEYLDQRNELIECNLGLVDRIALRYRTYGIPHTDLVQHGNLGLIRAADKFDWRRNVRFRTYAEWWIRQAIERATDTDRDVIHVPRPIRQKMSKANHMHRALGGQRPLDSHGFARMMGIEPGAAARVFSIKSGVASLERSGLDDGTPIKNDLIGPDLSGREESERLEHLRKRLTGMIDELPDREQRVLHLRYGLGGENPHTLEEVGTILHISRERVRQLQMRAIDHLRLAAPDPRATSDS
jgi:RNA polymerase primary sigma factor